MTEGKRSNSDIFWILLSLAVAGVIIHDINKPSGPPDGVPVPVPAAGPLSIAQSVSSSAVAEKIYGYSDDYYESAKAEAVSDLTADTARKTEAPRPSAATRSEKEFLRKHDGAFRKYQGYLREVGSKYWAKYPAIKRLDADFAKMDRYMALNRQYEKDRDAYKWARGVAALPEVRKKILSYAGNPEVLGPMIQACMDALKNPPPAPIQNEVLRVLTSDKEVAPYVTSVAAEAMRTLPMALPAAVPPGTDLSSLQKMAEQLTPGGKSAVSRNNY